MSEVKKTNKTEEVKEETAAKKPAAKKPAEKEKKDNVFKRTGRKVKNWMSEHPFINSMISAGAGAGIAVGAGYGGKKLIESRRNRKYAAVEDEQE